MSNGRHHRPHPNRSKSRYPQRLKRRGVTAAAVHMADVEDLRALQQRRAKQTGSPWPGKAELRAEQEDVA